MEPKRVRLGSLISVLTSILMLCSVLETEEPLKVSGSALHLVWFINPLAVPQHLKPQMHKSTGPLPPLYSRELVQFCDLHR